MKKQEPLEALIIPQELFLNFSYFHLTWRENKGERRNMDWVVFVIGCLFQLIFKWEALQDQALNSEKSP
jgi:hypothetical protein